jgi:hypothetical protein
MKRYIDANLHGCDTGYYASIGPGPRDWPPAAFRGPVLWPCDFHVQASGPFCLPKSLLTRFYQRMVERNPRGVVIVTPAESEAMARPAGVSIEEFNRRAENYEFWLDIFNPLHQNDWHLLREYLPEMLVPGAAEQVMADPELSVDLLGWAIAQGIVARSEEHDCRWSPAWLELCQQWKTGQLPLPDPRDVRHMAGRE